MENKKTLILSIIGILVLVIAVVGVSFAMYSFTGTGTKTNVIQTGSISLNVAKEEGNSFTFDKAYPMSDARGIQEGNSAEVSVSGTWTATTPLTINYDLGVEVTQSGTTLTEEHVKIALLDNTGRVVVGSVAGTDDLSGGVTIASLKNTQTTNKYLDGYALTKGVLTSSGKPDTYRIIGWVADTYDLPTNTATSTTDNTGSLTTDGLHKKETASETFKFKLVVEAAQV